jgi:hypothetical protein
MRKRVTRRGNIGSEATAGTAGTGTDGGEGLERDAASSAPAAASAAADTATVTAVAAAAAAEGEMRMRLLTATICLSMLSFGAATGAIAGALLFLEQGRAVQADIINPCPVLTAPMDSAPDTVISILAPEL